MYKFLDHTADLYVEVKAKNIKNVFIDSAKSISEYISDLDKCDIDNINLTFIYEDKIENILIQFLNEIAFFSLVKKLYLRKINEFNLTPFSEEKDVDLDKEYILNIECNFNKIKRIKREIKAITYCNIKLIKEKNFYRIKFIVDI